MSCKHKSFQRAMFDKTVLLTGSTKFGVSISEYVLRVQFLGSLMPDTTVKDIIAEVARIV